MIKVEFFSQEGRRTGFSVSGHSGYAEAGADVICAAVTAIVRYAEATLNDILGVGAKTRVDAEKALITLTLPASCEDEDTVQAILSKGPLAPLMRPTKFPEIPVSLERNTEVFRHPLL